MKRLIALALVLVALVPSALADLYPLTARVYAIDYDEDTVIVETFNGDLFDFDGVEDWAEDDCCSLIMDDNGTALIYDDAIVSARYCAWTLTNWCALAD